MNCRQIDCRAVLKLKRPIFRNGKEHFASWCPECREYRYWPQTPQNKLIFAEVAPAKSKPLIQAEAQRFQQTPESVLGKFGSDYELLFATSFKATHYATVLKRGCPDFLVEANGKIFFVEVKHGGDKLSRYQKKFKELLEKAGIRVFVSPEGKLTSEILSYVAS